MKRMAAVFAAMLMLVTLCACGAEESFSPGVLIGEDTEAVAVSHTVAGTLETADLTGTGLNDLIRWAGGLECESVEFGEGETPGDAEGGEAWSFSTSDGELFSYISVGSISYVLAEGDWYLVGNPSEPPISSYKVDSLS